MPKLATCRVYNEGFTKSVECYEAPRLNGRTLFDKLKEARAYAKQLRAPVTFVFNSVTFVAHPNDSDGNLDHLARQGHGAGAGKVFGL